MRTMSKLSTITKKDLLPLITPGEYLKEELLEVMKLSTYALAKGLGVPVSRVQGILENKRAITPDTATRLALYFGSTPEFWLNLQSHYDLRVIEREKLPAIRKSVSSEGRRRLAEMTNK